MSVPNFVSFATSITELPMDKHCVLNHPPSLLDSPGTETLWKKTKAGPLYYCTAEFVHNDTNPRHLHVQLQLSTTVPASYRRHLNPNFFFSLSFFLTLSICRSRHWLLRSLIGRFPTYLPANSCNSALQICIKHTVIVINTSFSINRVTRWRQQITWLFCVLCTPPVSQYQTLMSSFECIISVLQITNFNF